MTTTSVQTITSSSVTIRATLDSAGSNKSIDRYYRVHGTSTWSLHGGNVCNNTDVDYDYVYSSLTSGTTYDFEARFFVSGSLVATLDNNSVTTSGSPPSPPANLTGLTGSAGESQVSLSWNPASGASYYVIYWNGGANSTTTSSTSITITGLTNGTSYTFVVYGANSSGSGGTESISLTPNGSPPSGSTTITPTAQTGHQFSVSWTAVSGATGYLLYKSSDGSTYYPWDYGNTGASDVGNVTSHTVPIDDEWQTYYFQVTPYNTFGNGTNSFSSPGVKSLDETDPSVTAFSETSKTTTTVTVSITGNDNDPTSGTPSGVQRFAMYKDGSFDGYATVSGPSDNSSHTTSYTFSSLTAGTSYTFEARAVDYSGNLSTSGAYTISVTTDTGRPTNFSWTYSTISSGSNAEIDYRDWNALTSKINDFRSYQSLSAASFTTVATSDDITAAIFNEARNAIAGMSPPTSPPSTKSSGDDIYASDIDLLRTSLNSIT